MEVVLEIEEQARSKDKVVVVRLWDLERERDERAVYATLHA